eukprot:CAMPEP_0205804788 /NCGR_PEP_ID=MMETSP0205-20121125/7817_1 /ASSEMBLY_ACC=CAM_ASM_000278 /TAXON_ID=36767 /ORGANISM="Euplotes focardii, Strain TN1" /LENGTH=200 /DNA_ID=CAMNT_0053074967 /DNA_START=444 /DNA_END=1043 /DNA_ORIENTATION=+
MFGNTDLLRTQQDIAGKHKRKFSVLAVDPCETVKLGIEHLTEIKQQFPDIYDEVFNGIDIKFKRITSLKKRAVRVILQEDSSQKITDKNGIEIGIEEYKNKTDKNDAIQDAIDINQLDEISYSEDSILSEEANEIEENINKPSLKGLMGKIMAKKLSAGGQESRIVRLENKINQLDSRLDKVRGQINQDMRDMLLEFMGQ